MTDHIQQARQLLSLPTMTNPDGSTRTLQISESTVRRGQAEAILAVAEELRMANRIACSQPVYIRDAPDAIRRHFGEEALAAPEFDQASHLAMLEGHLRQGLEEYFTEERMGGKIFSDVEDGAVGVDGRLDLIYMARFLAGYVAGIRG